MKSAGTSSSARVGLSAKTVIWADIIFVMEKKHRQQILERYSAESQHKTIIILDIPDVYRFMDPELIEDIRSSVDSYLEL